MPSLNSNQDGARYDGWATWYDEYLKMPFYENIPAHLSRLVGPGSGLCVDIGCGTGVHLQLLQSLGWSVIGVDLSADQLRLASDRSPRVVQANACSLPFSSATFRRVVSVLTLTDFDDVGPFLSEAHRVLDRHGRFVILGTHPCFLGPFATIERDTGIARIHPGYRETARVFEGPGLGEGIRSKVGVRHVPLAELFNKLLAADLRLESVAELDGDTLPSLLAIVATKA